MTNVEVAKNDEVNKNISNEGKKVSSYIPASNDLKNAWKEENIFDPKDYYDDQTNQKEQGKEKQLTEEQKNRINRLHGSLLTYGFKQIKEEPKTGFGYHYAYFLKAHELEKGAGSHYVQSFSGKLYYERIDSEIKSIRIRYDEKDVSILHIDVVDGINREEKEFNIIKDHDVIQEKIRKISK